MTTPPLLLAAALLFWGWHTGFLVGAALLAMILEGSRAVAWRWELSRHDVDRLRNLCALVQAVILVYLLSTVDTLRAILVALSLYPLTVLPLIVGGAYDAAGTVDAGRLFFLSGTATHPSEHRPRAPIAPSYPYLAIVLLAASAANVRGPWFYPGLCLLSAWALWSIRPTLYPPLVWGTLLASAGALGYAGHVGLQMMQQAFEPQLIRWLFDAGSGGETDPYRSSTAIGQIGTLKLSDAIAFRVEASGAPVPLLLRAATYNRYGSSLWSAAGAGFEAAPPGPDGSTWTLYPGAEPSRSLTILAPLAGGRGVLPLPEGTFRIERLPVADMQHNRFGTVKVRDGPSFAGYRALFDPRATHGTPPDAADLSVPLGEASLISRISMELRLPSVSPPEALQIVSDYFGQRFRYSLFQPDRPVATSPLEEFLLRSRSGHCEYFATATVLLLRQAGIPARYATGYAVQEFSRLENRYVVRHRHAHAWALAYVNGAWQALDTTPASWVEAEQEAASWRQPISDLWSWAMFQVSGWWRDKGEPVGRLSVVWLLIPLGLLVAWRFYAAKRVALPHTGRQRTPSRPVWPGEDSDFYALEKQLSEIGLGRKSWEPLAGWVERIEATHILPMTTDSLRALVSLHYHYRFDPQGISAADREGLRSGVRAALETLAANPPHPRIAGERR